ncbi:MAG: GtrA family protein [Limnohabitans sp.]
MNGSAEPTTPSPSASHWVRSAGWFLLVGGAAALTHLGVFVWLNQVSILWPEISNAAGFGVAFVVSFVGHRWLSFADTGTGVLQSLWRFGASALAGFACNEGVFMLLHRGLGWPALPALIAALIVAAAQTFVLGRFWAFKR